MARAKALQWEDGNQSGDTQSPLALCEGSDSHSERMGLGPDGR